MAVNRLSNDIGPPKQMCGDTMPGALCDVMLVNGCFMQRGDGMMVLGLNGSESCG